MKAQADIVYLLAYGFASSIAIIVIIAAWLQLSSSPAWVNQIINATTNPTGASISAHATTAILMLANFFTILWIASAIASIVATFMVDSHPVFAVVAIIAMPIEILLAMIFHDFFFVIASNSFIAPVVALIPTMQYFYIALPTICLVITAVSVVFTFGKPS